jgi:hypothetical protein
MSNEDPVEKVPAKAEQRSADDIATTIEKLKGHDKVGNAGEAIATAGGVAAGATAAGAIAGAVGATTFLGSTTLGGLVGGVLVVSTPVGWVIGCAVAGGAAAYGISRMIRSGGRQDEVRNAIRRRLLKRLNDLRSKRGDESAIQQLRPAMTVAINQGVLSDANATRMLSLVEDGSLPAQLALERIRGLLTASNLSA